jgi:predicted N-acetyltransferase YhbS
MGDFATPLLEDLAGVVPGLQFSQNLAGLFVDHVVGALEKPNPATDPMSAYRYLRARRDTIAAAGRQRPLIRMQDEHLDHIARVGGEMSCVAEEVATDSGEASVVIRGDGHYLSQFVKNMVRLETDLHLSIDPIPTSLSWRRRWGGKITQIHAKRDSSGVATVELVATHQREHLKHIMISPSPIPGQPPEIALPKMYFLPGNTRTIAWATLWLQVLRIYSPLRLAAGVLNPGSWVDTLTSGALSPMNYPQQAAWVNPVLDQSRTSMLSATWNDFHTSTLDVFRDAGVIARSYTFFTEDEENPHAELEALVGPKLAHLACPQRNCVIHSFEDKSGYEGPTGTAADGLINLVASTADDLITNTVVPIDRDGDGEPDPLFRRLAMVAPEPPKVIYREGQHSGIIESNVTLHKGPVKTIYVGGHSPKLLNDLQTYGIRYAISQIAQVIPLGPAGAYEQFGAEGLDNVYQGQFDDTFFAYQAFTDPMRALHTGSLAYAEHFERGGSGTAYVVSGLLTIRVGWYKKRAYRSFKTSIRNAAPHLVLVDYELGDRLGFEQDRIVYADQVAAIRYEYDRRKPITYGVSIGDDSQEDDPLTQGVRALQAVASLAGLALGEGTLF